MYHKELYVFDGNRPVPAVIRNYGPGDFPGLIAVQQESFPPPFPPELWWNTEQLGNHVRLFPEGALCIEINGEIAGSMTGLLVKNESVQPGHAHTWEEVTDGGYIRNHDPHGGTLYVADISVRPTYRKLGLGKWLMLSMYDVVVQLGIDRLLGGGRMPGYHLHAGNMTAEEYLEAVISGRLKDPIITFMLRCGRTPVGVVPNYLEDEESCHYGALMEWRNPFKR
ncbi:GNAT family N-acetyltransferase [Paenibacillus woosongensis]|uniref:GNAT family N-acetyltransferase n=1 Tax=Paenibacillus woosongensis TaxID=307580 RepID=A0A7X2Z3K8_9BACL|nr:GNAT family N-acetyltransferase [Paenibacillus woosongensis]MUG46897.1 GNAT family N-acetyltransferase [Paenibacillus woosongensis]